jgi:RNA polymerase sigma factor (sigma-70 family)
VTPARRERLILENMPMVRAIARQCAVQFLPHLPFEDFLQDGYVGLCDAARRCQSIATFPQFAYFRIRGQIIRTHSRKQYREELNTSLDRPGYRLHRIDPDPLPDELYAHLELRSLAAAVIAKLPADERYVIRETLHGIALRAIAMDCGKSATWTREKLASAQGKVIAAVGEKKIDSL